MSGMNYCLLSPKISTFLSDNPTWVHDIIVIFLGGLIMQDY